VVQLVTQPPEVQRPDMNILLGSFQRNEGSIIGSIAEGVEVAARTYENSQLNKESGIDEQFALDLIASAENQALKRELGRTKARDDQTGNVPGSSIRASVALRKALARGLPLEVAAKTANEITGTSLYSLILSEADQLKEDPRDNYIKFLESQNERVDENGTFIYDLDNEQLKAFANRKSREQDFLRDKKNEVDVLAANNTIDLDVAVTKLRTEYIPGQVKNLHAKVMSRLQEAGLVTQSFDDRGVPRERALDMSELSPEDIESGKRFIRNIRDTIEGQVRNTLALRPGHTEAQVQQAMELVNVYTREAELILNGESDLATLETINKLADAKALNSYYSRNPFTRPAIQAATELSKVISLLGPEAGFDLSRNIASFIMGPAVEGVIVDFSSMLDSEGLNEKEKKELYRALSGAALNSKLPPEVRAKSYSGLSASLAKGAAQNPDLFDGMLDLLADPKGAQAYLGELSQREQDQYRTDIVIGLGNYLESLQKAVVTDFNRELSRPVLPANIPGAPGFNRTLEEQTEFFNALELGPRELEKFVDDNLFLIEGADFNEEALEGLSEREKDIVFDKFRKMKSMVGPRLKRLRDISNNFGMLKETVERKPPKEDSKINVEIERNK